MKAKKYSILVLLALSAALLVSLRLFADTPTEQEIASRRFQLIGLKGVHVSVATDDYPELQESVKRRYGIIEKELQTFAELQLRRNRIPILSQKECEYTEGSPTIVISCWVASFDTADYKTNQTPGGLREAALKITVIFWEDAILMRAPHNVVNGVVWKSGIMGIVPTQEINSAIKSNIEKMLGEFCNDYLAANPKEPTKKKRLSFEDLIEPDKSKNTEPK